MHEGGLNDFVRDRTEAVKWYRKAAEQGNADGQNMLGLSYATGAGVTKDSFEAVKWFFKAAEQGHTEAQGNLGGMYARGDGVAKDNIEGLARINIAAASGTALFVKNREILETLLGKEATLTAQLRSKEILKEIESPKR